MKFLFLNSARVPEDKREQLKLESAIVSIELHPSGEDLLLGYAGGTAIVAQPQAIPLQAPPAAEPSTSEPAPAVNGEKEPAVEPTETKPEAEKTESAEPEAAKPAAEGGEASTSSPAASQPPKKSKTGERHAAANLQAIRAEATKKFRTLSKTIKSKIEKTEIVRILPFFTLINHKSILMLIHHI